MTISAIIPAFNCSGYLEQAVDSIAKSGLKTLEILIINDGSTDNTETIALKLRDQYPNVRVISQPNGGASAARNRGVREAVGDYVYFMDADDALGSGSLADVNEILEAERPDMLLFGMVFDYYRHGKTYRSDVLCYPQRGIMKPSEWAREFEALFACNMLSPVWNKLIRRDLIMNDHLAFREDMIEMEDYLFTAQCLLSCEQIYLLDNSAYRYRQAENERGTFNRLWRIRSLSEYVQPFYEAAQELEARFSKDGVACGAVAVSDRIYSILFHEQLRFASPEQIKLAARDMLSGEHAGVIACMDPALYQNLKERRYARVWAERALGRARHAIAVQVKYRRCLRDHE